MRSVPKISAFEFNKQSRDYTAAELHELRTSPEWQEMKADKKNKIEEWNWQAYERKFGNYISESEDEEEHEKEKPRSRPVNGFNKPHRQQLKEDESSEESEESEEYYQVKGKRF